MKRSAPGPALIVLMLACPPAVVAQDGLVLRADGGDTQGFLYLAATVSATPGLTLATAFGHVDEGAAQAVTGMGLHAGAFYAFHPQARLHALYSRLDPDLGPDLGNFALGLTLHFALEKP